MVKIEAQQGNRTMSEDEDEERQFATSDEVIKARRIYATNEIEIDEYPQVSIAYNGVWVQAWVWLPKEGK